MCSKIKRERSTNFIDTELDLLTDLVLKQKHIIENKKTDAITASLKNKAWETLCKAFNSKSLNGYRSEKCLKSKYENLKKNVKIKLREVKSKPCATGGGPAIPQKSLSKLTATEEKIRSINPLAFDGKVSFFDSDSIQNENTQLLEELITHEDNDNYDITNEIILTSNEDNHVGLDEIIDNGLEKEVTEVVIDWNDYTPAKLKTPISVELSNTSYIKTPQERRFVNSHFPDTHNDSKASSCDELEYTVKSSGNQKLTNKINSVYARKQASFINTNKDWSEVAKIKIDVLHLKKQILEEELIFKRKEQELKLEILNYELLTKKKTD